MARSDVAGTSPPEWDAERVSLGRHFLRDMESLWAGLLQMAAVVEETLTLGVRALCHSRPDLAAAVKNEESEIDRREVQLERECLRILALHQPVASDLRRVTAVLKINSDLERMADLALHIAKRVKKSSGDATPIPIPQGMEAMAMESLSQVHDCLDALTRSDSDLARRVIASDRRFDALRRDIQNDLKDLIRKDPDRLDSCLRLINTARNLERIADHATNIAEAVIYLKEGKIVRHDDSTGRWVDAQA
ncbi:phosphate signaling complex protein PhoU [Isosphaeraceae bacterium EP7]